MGHGREIHDTNKAIEDGKRQLEGRIEDDYSKIGIFEESKSLKNLGLAPLYFELFGFEDDSDDSIPEGVSPEKVHFAQITNGMKTSPLSSPEFCADEVDCVIPQGSESQGESRSWSYIIKPVLRSAGCLIPQSKVHPL